MRRHSRGPAGYASLRQRNRQDTVVHIDLIPPKAKLFLPPEACLDCEGHQQPVGRAHHVLKLRQLVLGQVPGPI